VEWGGAAFRNNIKPAETLALSVKTKRERGLLYSGVCQYLWQVCQLETETEFDIVNDSLCDVLKNLNDKVLSRRASVTQGRLANFKKDGKAR
jgi:hypothetical protein